MATDVSTAIWLAAIATFTGRTMSANTTVMGQRFCTAASPCTFNAQCIQGLCFCYGVLWTDPICSPSSVVALLRPCTVTGDCSTDAAANASAASLGQPACGSSAYCYTPCADKAHCGSTGEAAACVGGVCICTLDNTIKVGDCSEQSRVIFRWWMPIAALTAILAIIFIVLVFVCRRRRAQRSTATSAVPTDRAKMKATTAQPSPTQQNPKMSAEASNAPASAPLPESPAAAPATLATDAQVTEAISADPYSITATPISVKSPQQQSPKQPAMAPETPAQRSPSG